MCSFELRVKEMEEVKLERQKIAVLYAGLRPEWPHKCIAAVKVEKVLEGNVIEDKNQIHFVPSIYILLQFIHQRAIVRMYIVKVVSYMV